MSMRRIWSWYNFIGINYGDRRQRDLEIASLVSAMGIGGSHTPRGSVDIYINRHIVEILKF
jgi:hypothetical protein